MTRTINRVELLGRLGAEPELRRTQQGMAVVQLRLATERRSRTEVHAQEVIFLDPRDARAESGKERSPF